MYFRHLVETVGRLDTEYYKFAYIETDYAARAHYAGFINGAMGMDIVHTVFGVIPSSDPRYYDTAADLERLNSKYTELRL